VGNRLTTPELISKDIAHLVDESVRTGFDIAYRWIDDERKEMLSRIRGTPYEDLGEVKTRMGGVYGKTDVLGVNETIGKIHLEADVKANLDEDLIKALTDATFTAKNYLSTGVIGFGKTNLFRVFTSIVGPTLFASKRFYRTVECVKHHNAFKIGGGDGTHPESPVLLYRLRALYEISGIGQFYVKRKFAGLNGAGAKFLIWNTPTTLRVRVIPTRKIINNLVTSIKPKSLY
jgi:hypothetical protein